MVNRLLMDVPGYYCIMDFLLRTLATAVALWVATIVPGISLTGDTAWQNILTLLVVALIFGVINAVLKPIIKVVGCVFYVLTLGLIALVVNALLFLLTGWIADQADRFETVHCLDAI